eukprot:13647286-Alexandrium_andersonii.AAC.1
MAILTIKLRFAEHLPHRLAAIAGDSEPEARLAAQTCQHLLRQRQALVPEALEHPLCNAFLGNAGT